MTKRWSMNFNNMDNTRATRVSIILFPVLRPMSDSEDCQPPPAKQPKLEITDLSDDEPGVAVVSIPVASEPPCSRQFEVRERQPPQHAADKRARVSHVVGTVCTCARRRQKFAMSCNRQFKGDVHQLTVLRLELRKLDQHDMDSKAGVCLVVAFFHFF